MVTGPSILLGLWAAANVAAAPSVSAPASDTLASLAAQAGKLDVVVWSGKHKYRLARARFDSTGVWSPESATYRGPRQAVVVTADAPPGRDVPPKPIPWGAVDSIATVKEPSGPVIVAAVLCAAGAVVGLFVAGVGLATHSSDTSNAAAIGSIAVPAVLAVALMSSSAAHTHIKVIYRTAHP